MTTDLTAELLQLSLLAQGLEKKLAEMRRQSGRKQDAGQVIAASHQRVAVRNAVKAIRRAATQLQKPAAQEPLCGLPERISAEEFLR